MLLSEFFNEHDNWRDILTNKPYCINISEEDKYILLKYNQIESDFSIPIVRECRGVIFRKSDMQCVCHPFDKFGNYGESYCPEIDWNSASVQEKIDGSLIKLWYDDGYWHVSTNGTIDANNAHLQCASPKTGEDMSFYDLFIHALQKSGLDDIGRFDEVANHDCCYMFELVSPYNRVVIPYESAKLYFLGYRDMVSDKEYSPETSGVKKFFDIPKRFELHTLTDVVDSANQLPWDEEGYVVCDRYFNRVKIKSPEYVRAHYIRNNNVVTLKKIVEIVLSGESEEFRIYSNDYIDVLDDVENRIDEMCTKADSVAEGIDTTLQGKEYAEEVKSQDEYMWDFLFKYKKNKLSFIDYLRGKTYDAVSNMLERVYQ